MKPILSAVPAFLLTALGAVADTTVTVSDVVARQRYPWNGLVDITCAVSGIDGETNGLKLAVAAVMPDTGRARNVSHFQMERGGKWSDDREVRTNGVYRLLWDASADLGPMRFTNMVVRVTFDTHEKVQLWEGGPYWATTNVGAENPEDCGLYFWWGDTIGYSCEGNAWVASDGSSSNFSFISFGPEDSPTYGKDNFTLKSEGWITAAGVLASEHDAAHVHWGGAWRMPMKNEHSALLSNCDWTWTTRNGVNGYVVRGRGDFAAFCIFLPAAGSGYGTRLGGVGSYGCYWSSVPSESDSYFSWSLYFNSSDCSTNDIGRLLGQSVRPVQGFAE